MRKSVLVALLLGAALAAWTGSGTAYAAPLPTHGDVVHLDLNPAAAYDTLLPWPGIPAAPNPVVGGRPPTFAGSFEGGEFVQFTDGLQSFQLHMWENEIRNQSSIRRTFKLLIQDRDPAPLNRWFYVTLDPGWSILIDLHVDEGVLDMGAFTWLAGSLLKYQIGVDSSVTENRLLRPHPFPFPCPVNTDGCLAVNFVDPGGNVVPPNLATGGLVLQRQFSGCPDVFLLKTNQRIRVPWFAKLRCLDGRLVLLVGDQVVQQLYPAPATLPPSVTAFAINNGAATTTSRNVTLDNTYTGIPTEYMASESPTFTGAAWLPYGTAPHFLLSAGNGTKTVYFKVRDAAHQASDVVSDTIDLAVPPPPAVDAFAINNGAATTTSQNVTLDNTCSGIPTEYMASESPTFIGADWQPYATAPPFTLSAWNGTGTKTVYFKVRDAALQESPAVSDTIDLDIPVPPPSVDTFAINNGAATTTSRNVTLDNTCTGNPTEYMASESPTFLGAAWQPYATAPPFALSPGNGTKTVYFKVRDAALQESLAVSDTIVLDAPPPGGIDDYVTLGASGGNVAFAFLAENESGSHSTGISNVVRNTLGQLVSYDEEWTWTATGHVTHISWSGIQYNTLGQKVSFDQQWSWSATGNMYQISVSGITYNSFGQVTSYDAAITATIGGNIISGTRHYPGP